MNRKLMLLAAGALSALAFAALPALASAGEYEAHCEGAHICEGTITGVETSELENTNGDLITCEFTEGSTSFTTTTTTGTATLLFRECREHVTFFTFKCNSAGKGAGEIETSAMTYHVVNLEHGGTTPGIKFTNVSVTFECTGFSKKTVTGSVVGHIEEPAVICNTAVTTHKVAFEESATGVQKYMQITTTGTKTDLISNNHAGGAYLTSAQIGTGIIHWNHPVKITC